MSSTGSYIHWHNERSPYAVELNAALVGQIIEEVAAAQDLGIEAGGVLVGTFPRAAELTVRIERIISIERRAEDGAEFVLGGAQKDRFRAAVREANTRETSAVGFYRSQRGSKPALSNEDRKLSSEEFKNSVHVILLVGAEQPRFGSIYLSTGMSSPPEIAVPEFGFSRDELRSVTTVNPSTALANIREEVAPPPGDEVPPDQRPMWREAGELRRGLFAIVAVCLVIAAFAAGFLLRPMLPGSELERGLPHSKARLDLGVVSGPGRVLQISWNHQAPVIFEANYGTLEIADGLQAREIRLSPNELETGSVAYERVNEHLLATLILTMPDGSTVSQSCSWYAK